MTNHPATPSAGADSVGAAHAEESPRVNTEGIGASFLGLIALVLLFALLRAQQRNRNLMRELMEARLAAQGTEA